MFLVKNTTWKKIWLNAEHKKEDYQYIPVPFPNQFPLQGLSKDYVQAKDHGVTTTVWRPSPRKKSLTSLSVCGRDIIML